MGLVVKALAISLRSGNSTFAPSDWFMHAWSHIHCTAVCLLFGKLNEKICDHHYGKQMKLCMCFSALVPGNDVITITSDGNSKCTHHRNTNTTVTSYDVSLHH